MKRNVTPVFFALISLSVSFFVAGIVLEKIFFDEVYYKKSITHGYWPVDEQVRMEDFGKRGRDMATLMNNINNTKIVLGATTLREVYTILVFGDSYVWGKGIKNEHRFAKVLEETLNTIRPTRVIALGNSGDNLLDNYLKYLLSTRIFPEASLYIFGVVNNDLFMNQRHRYDAATNVSSLLSGCEGAVVNDLLPGETYNKEDYARRIIMSAEKTSTNWCVFQKLLRVLPTNKTMYLNLDGFLYPGWEIINAIMNEFVSNGMNVIPRAMPAVNKEDNNRRMLVSEKDSHPSAYANKKIADVLFREITTNPTWGFGKTK